MGIADRVFVAIGSDFGRTPGYNGGNGKDHWSVNSMILMGAGVPGNRVIGASGPRHQLMQVNPQTLEVVESGGVRLRPDHVHAAIRKLAGLERDPLSLRYPLQEEDINLLG